MARQKNVVDDLSLSRFANELRALRSELGLSQAELGEIAGYSRQAVGEIERQTRPPTRAFAEALDAALEARGTLLSFFPRRGAPERQRLLDGYVPLERQAVSLDQWHAQVVPALLQTDDYARADLAGTVPPQPSQVLSEWLQTRMERQSVFERDVPLDATFVIDEGALRRQIGGPDVMAEQYRHILQRMEHPFITMQVLPFVAGAHPAQHGAATILHLNGGGEGGTAETVLYVETMGGSQILADSAIVAQSERRLSALRGLALSPADSKQLIRALLEGHS